MSFTVLATLDLISAFVAAGFEHSVANMYFISLGLLIKTDSAFLTTIGKSAADYVSLTWANFLLVNLLPVTLGNLIGGVVLVGLTYWFIYLRPESAPVPLSPRTASTPHAPTHAEVEADGQQDWSTLSSEVTSPESTPKTR